MLVEQRDRNAVAKYHGVAQQTGHFICGLGIQGGTSAGGELLLMKNIGLPMFGKHHT
ncbi:hypothetical protein D3C81_2289000 [compost metagenome]